MTRRALMLHLLREAGDRGVTTGELIDAGVGSRYGARLGELREHGHVVEAERIRDGAWKYTLTYDAERGIEPGRTGPEPSPPARFGVALGAAAAPLATAPTRGDGRSCQDAPPRVHADSSPRLFAAPVPANYRDQDDDEPGRVRAVRRQVG